MLNPGYPLYLASTQALPSRARKIISACKEGLGREPGRFWSRAGRGWTYVRGYQLAVDFAHTVTTCGRQRLDQTRSASYKLQRFLVVVYGGSNDQET